jgi:mitochondrial chaperone BCS1
MRNLIHEAFNVILHNQNQFASGGILLMALGSAMALLRKVPTNIWNWLVHQTTVTLTVTDDQRAFYWVKTWIENQRIMRRTRHMDVFNRGSEKYTLLPAPGHHWMLYKKRILSVTMTRTEEKKMGQTTRSETMTFKTFGRKQNVYREMMAEIHETAIKQEEKKPELYAWGTWGDWKEIHAYSPRPLDSVILPRGDKERIIRDLEAFKKDRDWYTTMGIPYRKGYLFHGPPGTGKTSLVTGLSSYFKANVYILKLGDMNDSTLREAVTETEPNSFFIMEDIDCIDSSRDRKKVKSKEGDKKSGVTLSGLLNVLDGMLSPSGAIFIMTTNHAEKLDPALLRPGRVDIKLHVTYATAEQKRALYNRFRAGDCPQEYIDKKMSMADLQQILMEQKILVQEIQK